MGQKSRAESPVMKLDFVNNALNEGVDSTAPQPRNHELAQVGATDDLGIVAVNSRALVDEALRQANVFSSEDLVEEGNTLPLIPLNIDPPAHIRYRKLLDPLFAPRRIDALEDDIAERVNHFVDGFIDRGSCDFTNEFAELFPSSVFLGMMGLPWEELPTLTRMRDGILRPGTAAMTPTSVRRSNETWLRMCTRSSTQSSTIGPMTHEETSCRCSWRSRWKENA